MQHRKDLKMDVKLSRDDWEKSYIEELRSSEKKSEEMQSVLDLYSREDKTNFQKRALKNLLDREYKTYSIKFDFDQSKKEKDNALSQLFDTLKKEKREAVARSRKERAHELITIGALTEVTSFEKDRGLIAGVLLDALDRFSQNESLRFDLKKRGDALLHQIEVENKSKKSTS